MKERPQNDRIVKAFNYNAIVRIDIVCPETGKQIIEDFRVKYYAGDIEPDKSTLIRKILKRSIAERKTIRK